MLATPPAADASARPLQVRHLVVEGTDPHPSQANGLHNVARRLAREQRAAGDAAEIIFLRPAGREAAAPRDVPTRSLALEGTRVAGRLVHLAPQVMAAMLEGAAADTVFHIHAGREPLLVGVGRALRARGIPYGLTVHGRYSHLFDRYGRITRIVPALYLRLVERLALEGATFVQGITLAECHLLQRVAPRAHVVQVPNAAYSSRLDGAPRRPVGGGPSATFPVFGYCGRYEPDHKGLDLLLQGFALYRRDGGGGRLVMFGTGPRRAEVAALAAALSLGEAVEIHGPRFDDEKRRTLLGWDFFVHPSRYDVLPTGCLEAALLGLPLIASVETGLVPHLGRHGAGFAIEALDASGVADALAAAGRTTPEGWRAMSQSVHRMALAIGDWTEVARRLRPLYRAAG